MLENINMVLCGYFMPVLLMALGVFLAFKLKFFYIIHPIKTAKTIIKGADGGFKSLSVALAGTLGVGNIVGVASAISMGGAGAIFWMWISSLCAMSLKYTEVFLGMKFRKKTDNGYIGGAPYYIKEGLSPKIGKKVGAIFSLIFAVLCILNSLSTGNLVQVNAVSSLSSFSPFWFGIIFATIILFIIMGGIKRIEGFASKVIPLLTISYIIISLYIIFTNISMVPDVFYLIIKEAFSARCVIGGFTGYGILMALRFGVSRGILSNEAGCGTSPTAHASSKTESPHAQACLGIFEVFIDTIVLCTLSAIVILLSGIRGEKNDMALVISSYEKFAGNLGKYIIIISSILFAFATVCTQFFYGAESLKYITKSKKWNTLYTLVFFAVCILGAIIPMSLMWQISDLVIGCMTLVHIICLLFLYQYVTKSSHF